MEPKDNRNIHAAKQQSINETEREKRRHIWWIIVLGILNLIALLLLFLLPYNCTGCSRTVVVHDTVRVGDDEHEPISEEEDIDKAVEEEGGDVNAFMRFSIMWNTNGRDIVDLDAHALEPSGAHIYFDKYCAPDKTRCGGQLDIDMRDPRRTGVENIVWPSASLLDDGEYQFLIHNYDDQRFSECDVKLIVGNKSFVYKVGHFRESNPVLIAIVTIKDHQVQNIDHKVAPIE